MEQRIAMNMSVRCDYPRAKVIQINVLDDQIGEWCLLLTLLRYDLLDAIAIVHDTVKTLRLRKNSRLTAKIANRRGVVSESVNSTELVISDDELDYWLSFFLQYYRDGIGDVDHIDLEVKTSVKDSSYTYFYLTLTVPKAKPPVPHS